MRKWCLALAILMTCVFAAGCSAKLSDLNEDTVYIQKKGQITGVIVEDFTDVYKRQAGYCIWRSWWESRFCWFTLWGSARKSSARPWSIPYTTEITSLWIRFPTGSMSRSGLDVYKRQGYGRRVKQTPGEIR